MNEAERRAEATKLVQEAYAGGRQNLDHITNELFDMAPGDRRDVIKKMERIDQKCHQDPEMARLMASEGKHLPNLQIIDTDGPHGHLLQIKVSVPKEAKNATAGH